MTINPTDPKFQEMIVSSVRYALGRMTYIVSDTVDFIIPLIPYFTDNTLYVMHKDITDCNNLGMECDKADWYKLRKAIEAEINSRNSKLTS